MIAKTWSPNKIVARKLDERNKVILEKKLQHIKGKVDQETPLTFRTMRVNRKRLQMKEERLTQIEHENKILLEKMTRIMNVPKSPPQKEFRIKSLNRDLRKRELVRIAVENQSILKRLQEKKSSYNRNEWVESRKKTESYLKNISQYPLTLRSSIRSPTSPRDQLETQFTDREKSRHSLNRKSDIVQSLTIYTDTRPPFDNSTSLYNGASTKNSTPLAYAKTTRVNSMPAIDTAKTMLYQTTKLIGFNKYLIEFYVQNRMFKIVAFNQFHNGLKVFSCSHKEGEQLLKSFDYNYPAIIERIHFKGNFIVIDQEDIYDHGEETEGKEEFPQANQFENPEQEKKLNGIIKEEEEAKDSPNVLQKHREHENDLNLQEEAPIEDRIEDKHEEITENGGDNEQRLEEDPSKENGQGQEEQNNNEKENAKQEEEEVAERVEN